MPDLTIPAIFLAGALFAVLLIVIGWLVLWAADALNMEDRL